LKAVTRFAHLIVALACAMFLVQATGLASVSPVEDEECANVRARASMGCAPAASA